MFLFQANSLEAVIQQCSLLTKVLCALLEHGAYPLDQLGQLNISEQLKKLLQIATTMLSEVRMTK